MALSDEPEVSMENLAEPEERSPEELRLKYACVVQDVDGVILLFQDVDEEYEYEDTVLRTILAPGYRYKTAFSNGSKFSIVNANANRTFHLLLQEEKSDVRLTYILISTNDFPPLVASQYLRDLRKRTEGAFPELRYYRVRMEEDNQRAQTIFTDLLKTYEARGKDSLKFLKEKIDETKEEAQVVVLNMDETLVRAKNAQRDVEENKKKAAILTEKLKEINRQEQKKRWKRRLLIIVIFAIVLALIVLLGKSLQMDN